MRAKRKQSTCSYIQFDGKNVHECIAFFGETFSKAEYVTNNTEWYGEDTTNLKIFIHGWNFNTEFNISPTDYILEKDGYKLSETFEVIKKKYFDIDYIKLH